MVTTTPVPVMLVDNQIALRTGLRVSLPAYGIEVICEAPDGKIALELLEKHHPAVIILELELKHINGFELIAIVKSRYPSIKTLIYTSQPRYLKNNPTALKLADFFLIKDDFLDQLAANILTLAMPKEVTTTLNEVLIQAASKEQEQIEDFLSKLSLTDQEQKVLQCLCQGASAKEIATTLEISQRTVDFHKKNLYEKTRTRTPAELGSFAVKYRLITI